jgi:hypothetical protein
MRCNVRAHTPASADVLPAPYSAEVRFPIFPVRDSERLAEGRRGRRLRSLLAMAEKSPDSDLTIPADCIKQSRLLPEGRRDRQKVNEAVQRSRKPRCSLASRRPISGSRNLRTQARFPLRCVLCVAQHNREGSNLRYRPPYLARRKWRASFCWPIWAGPSQSIRERRRGRSMAAPATSGGGFLLRLICGIMGACPTERSTAVS